MALSAGRGSKRAAVSRAGGSPQSCFSAPRRPPPARPCTTTLHLPPWTPRCCRRALQPPLAPNGDPAALAQDAVRVHFCQQAGAGLALGLCAVLGQRAGGHREPAGQGWDVAAPTGTGRRPTLCPHPSHLPRPIPPAQPPHPTPPHHPIPRPPNHPTPPPGPPFQEVVDTVLASAHLPLVIDWTWYTMHRNMPVIDGGGLVGWGPALVADTWVCVWGG